MIELINTKRNYLMILAVLFVLVSLSGTTYSLFLKSDTTDPVTYSTGILDLKFEEDKKISLSDVFPIIDSEALKQEGYDLTIENTGNIAYVFDLKMLSETNEAVIDSRYIKYKVNDSLPHTLWETSNIISSNVIIYPGEKLNFKINVWLDIDTPNSELGKTFTAKIATTGSSIYKTLDDSGANHPELDDGMLEVYYDNGVNKWKKADKSNTIENYKWYDYNNSLWANSVKIKDSKKQIYDITGNNNLDITDVKVNNNNIILDNNYLDIGLNNYNFDSITSVIRFKVNSLDDNIYLITNGNISYYYDVKNKKFIFENNNTKVSTNNFNIETGIWYITCFTYSNNKLSIYMDGNLINTLNINYNINSKDSFKLGISKENNKYSNIEIGDIYIYNRVLTNDEISSNYKKSISIIYNNLLEGYNEFSPMTLKEYYNSRSIGTNIDLSDIELFYVWIPRFKYKLWNVTGDDKIDMYDAYHKGIEISFEKNTESSGVIYCSKLDCYSDPLMITKVTQLDNGKYYTHPAFKDKDEDSTGFWVSKYELTTSNNICTDNDLSSCISTDIKLNSLPNSQVWRNNYLSNFYKVINDNKYSMIKNTEWGAITYLSHSKYGVCKNNICEEIKPNSTFISGNNINDSTTKNMSGVFDLAGSASEYMMSSYSDSEDLSFVNTNFGNNPISNYNYEIYTFNKFILGDATKELSSSWYDSANSFVNSTNNWFIRGGVLDKTGLSMFYYSATTDNPNSNISTRLVIK